MNGILGTWDLYANVNQAIYTNNYSGVNVVVVNLCNKSQEQITVRIAVSTSTTAPSDAEWIVYEAPVGPRSAYERTSIMVSPGQSVVVRSSGSSSNAICFGVTNAATAPGTNTRNLGSAPAWATATSLPLVYAGDSATSIQLSATDAENESVTYSVTSGSLLSGLSLSSTGLITGTPSVTGYTTGLPDSSGSVTISATDSRGNATPRTFSITKRWADGSSQALAAPTASAIKTLTGTTTNGNYWIKPAGQTAYSLYCDMNSDGGGWVMIAGGREAGPAAGGANNWWKDEGNGDPSTLVAANLASTSVRYLSTNWIKAYIGGTGNWSNFRSGMWVKRVDLGDSFVIRNNSNSPAFTWSDFNINPGSIPLTITRYPNFTFTSPSYTLSGYQWTDTLSYGAPVLNDATRLFTWTWTGHSNNNGQYQGWSAGSSISTPGFQAATEGHAIQLVNVFIK